MVNRIDLPIISNLIYSHGFQDRPALTLLSPSLAWLNTSEPSLSPIPRKVIILFRYVIWIWEFIFCQRGKYMQIHWKSWLCKKKNSVSTSLMAKSAKSPVKSDKCTQNNICSDIFDPCILWQQHLRSISYS